MHEGVEGCRVSIQPSEDSISVINIQAKNDHWIQQCIEIISDIEQFGWNGEDEIDMGSIKNDQ